MSKKNKNPKTHVAIVLDKSGSMGDTKDATISGYNEHVQQLKKNAQDGQEILVSLVTFNGEVFECNNTRQNKKQCLPDLSREFLHMEIFLKCPFRFWSLNAPPPLRRWR